jgi:hypothetical protein
MLGASIQFLHEDFESSTPSSPLTEYAVAGFPDAGAGAVMEVCLRLLDRHCRVSDLFHPVDEFWLFANSMLGPGHHISGPLI